mmetsp:Transcript_32315/g.76778  ORF Transcript_32315/g.76778 Transcript_32315/m.76778 type:complete len:254 (+) Transcript_32315:1277-2038(+)
MCAPARCTATSTATSSLTHTLLRAATEMHTRAPPTSAPFGRTSNLTSVTGERRTAPRVGVRITTFGASSRSKGSAPEFPASEGGKRKRLKLFGARSGYSPKSICCFMKSHRKMLVSRVNRVQRSDLAQRWWSISCTGAAPSLHTSYPSICDFCLRLTSWQSSPTSSVSSTPFSSRTAAYGTEQHAHSSQSNSTRARASMLSHSARGIVPSFTARHSWSRGPAVTGTSKTEMAPGSVSREELTSPSGAEKRSSG